MSKRTFPVKITFEYNLPDELSSINAQKITSHVFLSNDFWIFQEYMKSEGYIHLESDDYLWIWTDKKQLKSDTILGINTNFEIVEIYKTNNPTEFEKLVSQISQPLEKEVQEITRGYGGVKSNPTKKVKDLNFPNPTSAILLDLHLMKQGSIPLVSEPLIPVPKAQKEELEIPPMDTYIDVQNKIAKIIELSDKMYNSKSLTKASYRSLLCSTNKAFNNEHAIKDGNVILEETVAYNTTNGKEYYNSLPDTMKYGSGFMTVHPMFNYVLPIIEIVEELIKIDNDTVKTNLYYALVDNLLI